MRLGIAGRGIMSAGLTVAAGTGATNTLLDGLFAYWPGNEASGDLLDAHLAHDMTDTNTVTSDAGLVYATARQHTRANSEYFVRSNDARLHGGARDWTLATWLYITDPTINLTVWQDTGNAGTAQQVTIDTFSADKATLLMYNSVGGNAQAHATNFGVLPANTWLLLVCSYATATGQLAISVNGGTPNTATLSGTPRVSTSSIQQALGYSAGRLYGGRMGPTAYWRGRVLTAADITALYNNGAGLAYTALAGTAQATDLFGVGGQSNPSGRGTNSQVWSHASLLPLLFGNDYRWKLANDPTDSVTGQVDSVSNENPTPVGGSCWPLLATQLMTTTSRPVAFVPCAKGGSSITAWQPGADHQDRTTLYGSMVYRMLQAAQRPGMTMRGVIWWQGEQDVLDGMSQATYNAYLDTLANAVMADLGVPLIACKLQNCTGLDAGAQATINAAIAEAWADNPNVVAGPDLTGLTTDDTVHLKSDANLLSAATLWHNAIVAGISL